MKNKPSPTIFTKNFPTKIGPSATTWPQTVRIAPRLQRFAPYRGLPFAGEWCAAGLDTPGPTSTDLVLVEISWENLSESARKPDCLVISCHF